MVVASSTAENLEARWDGSASRFAIVNRSGRLEVMSKRAPTIGSNGDGEVAAIVSGLPPRGSGRRELPRGSSACATRACRGRWPMGSGRSRSSRPWGGAGFWGSSARPGCP